MVEIVNDNAHRIRCPNCEKNLQYTANEIQSQLSTENNIDMFIYINCPNCKRKVIIKKFFNRLKLG